MLRETRMTTHELTHLALLTSTGLILYVVEAMLPPLFPIPGAKLGLANIVTLVALTKFRPRDALLVLLSRIVLAGFFAGQLVSLMLSLAGGMTCFVMSLVALRLFHLRLPALSVVGAISHNMGQLAMATVILHTAAIFFYLPFLLIAAIPAGLLTAYAAGFVMKRIGM